MFVFLSAAPEPQTSPVPASGAAGLAVEPASFADLPTEHLEHEIERHAAAQNAGMCRWLELVAEFDRRQGWTPWGCLSCAHWISWRCSVSLRSAREHVRVARALWQIPAIHSEFAAGRLSYSKVRALSRVADSGNEAELLELAGHATASQLDLLVRSYSRANAVQAGDTHRHRYLSWFWETDGSLSIHANLPAEDGATVIAALETAAERLREDHCKEDHDRGSAPRVAPDQCSARPDLPQMGECGGSAEPPEGPRVSRAEALVAMAQDSMGPQRPGSKPADRNLVVVHVDLAELSEERSSANAQERGSPSAGGQRCHIRDGSGLSAETARRLACDASVVTLIERDGEPLSAGRRSRSIPPAMRRAVEARDGGCRFPGCHHHRYVDAHHIRHWARGGETSADNLGDALPPPSSLSPRRRLCDRVLARRRLVRFSPTRRHGA